ncbi:MAG: iron-containing alcohol dehydrogenase [Solirubrobacterales bacterium]
MKNIKFGDSIIIGKGSLDYLLNVENKKVFIVTGGKSMFNNGTISKIDNILKENNCEVYIHSGIKANPDTLDVEKGLDIMNKFEPDVIIGVGGGSPLDAAKVMSLIYEYPDINMNNILKVKLPQKREKVILIAIPSTSGSGTEVSKAAVITFKEHNLKYGIKCDAFIPDVAILDPEITMSMPSKVAAETGMDALTHAVESYINKNADDFTEALSLGAIEGIFKNLTISFNENSLEARGKMHNYQCMAAMSFANSGLGMAHGISHAIGGKFGLGHGLTNAIALPYVLKFNSRDPIVEEKLKKLGKIIDSNSFIESVIELNKILEIPATFKEAGITKEDFNEDFDALVENSMLGSTMVNPVKITKDEMAVLLKNIYG